MEGITIDRMTKCRCGKIYINTAAWGTKADSVESSYRVPFGSIHLFIGRVDGSEPEPYFDIPTEHASRSPTRLTHAFVGFVNGSTEPEVSIETLVEDDNPELSDARSYPSEADYTDIGPSIR